MNNTFFNNEFYLLDGVCGSGKTTAIMNYINSCVGYGKFIITASTKSLCDMIADGLNNSTVIHSDNSGSITRDIIEVIKDINNIGFGTLIITHSTFLDNLPRSLDLSEFDVFIDEKMIIQKFFTPTLPHHYFLLTDHFELGDQESGKWFKLKFKDEKTSREFVNLNRKAPDEVSDVIADLLKVALDDHTVFINGDQWNKITSGDYNIVCSHGSYTSQNQISFLALLNVDKFQGFRSITFSHANASIGLLKDHFERRHGINWKISPLPLLFKEHDGSRLTLIPVLPKMSKYVLCKTPDVENLTSRLQCIINEIIEDMEIRGIDNEPVMYTINNNITVQVPVNWHRLPVVLHGLNEYQDYKIVVHLAALNYSPQNWTALNDTGVSDDIIKSEIYNNSYLFVWRSAIRNLDSSDPVIAYVGDLDVAKFITKLAPGSKIEPLNESVMFEKRPFSQIENNHRTRLLRVIRELTLDGPFHSTIFKNFSDTTGIRVNFASFSKLIAFMSTCWTNHTNRSEQSMWRILPTWLADENSDQTVYKENCSSNDKLVSYLCLDINDGNPKVFETYFKEKRCAAAIFPTVSSTLEHQKFRIFVPLSRGVTVDEYIAIQKSIIADLEVKNYFTPPLDISVDDYKTKYPDRKLSGLDISDMTPHKTFILPGKIINRERHGKPIKIKCEKKYIEDRGYVIDVEKIIRNKSKKKPNHDQ